MRPCMSMSQPLISHAAFVPQVVPTAAVGQLQSSPCKALQGRHFLQRSIHARIGDRMSIGTVSDDVAALVSCLVHAGRCDLQAQSYQTALRSTHCHLSRLLHTRYGAAQSWVQHSPSRLSIQIESATAALSHAVPQRHLLPAATACRCGGGICVWLPALRRCKRCLLLDASRLPSP